MIKFLFGFAAGAISMGVVSIVMFFKIGYALEDEIYEEVRKEYERGLLIDDDEEWY